MMLSAPPAASPIPPSHSLHHCSVAVVLLMRSEQLKRLITAHRTSGRERLNSLSSLPRLSVSELPLLATLAVIFRPLRAEISIVAKLRVGCCSKLGCHHIIRKEPLSDQRNCHVCGASEPFILSTLHSDLLLSAF